MNMQFEDLTLSSDFPCEIDTEMVKEGIIKIVAHFRNDPSSNRTISVYWNIPLIDIQYDWYPNCKFDRSVRPFWSASNESMISRSAPVWVFYNACGINRLTVALSDAKTRVTVHMGVEEKDTSLSFRIDIPVDICNKSGEYSICLYRNMDDVMFTEALHRVTEWWEKDCGMQPMRVPEIAKEPLYSCWYSYHQHINAAEIEDECTLAAEYGMKSVIVDDGWQTEDDKGGYAYCGDWEAAPGKIPDMKEHIEKVHQTGLRYILWYSVPFVGRSSHHWQTFKDKLIGIREGLNAGVLDPRYPSVREYIIQTYVTALKNWNLDGFKLDFIDSFGLTPVPDPQPEMDYTSVEEAVECLMTDVMTALLEIKPDIMIEFRQKYIGPIMRTYGNMFRVGDCPGNVLCNRVGTIDLRLLSGNTAVHSDMLTWNVNDTKEAVALQLMNVVFAVPQISVKIEQLKDEHCSVLRFWLRFMKEHRDILLDSPVEVEAPQCLYPLVRAEKNHHSIIAVYQINQISTINSQNTECWVLNACYQNSLILNSDRELNGKITIMDCTGQTVDEKRSISAGINRIEVPPCGLIHIDMSPETVA